MAEKGLRYRFGEFALFPQRRKLMRGLDSVTLSPRAFDVLALLVERAPGIVTKDDFAENVWHGEEVSDNTIGQFIFAVRSTLGSDYADAIQTIHTKGYRFQLGVRAEPDDAVRVAEAGVRELYDNARYFFSMRTDPGLRSCVRMCSQAIAIEADFAPAYALRAQANVMLADGYFEAPADAMAAALESAGKALELEPSNAEALAALAGVQLYYLYDPRAAYDNAGLVMANAPSTPVAYILRAWAASVLQNFDDANAVAETSAGFVPHHVTQGVRAGVAYFQGDFERAISLTTAVLNDDSSRQFPRYVRAVSTALRGDLAAAAAELELVRRQPILPVTAGYSNMRLHATAVLADVYTRLQKTELAAEASRIVESFNERGMAFFAAAVAASSADTAGMYEYLERARVNRDPWLPFVATEHFFSIYAKEDRFVRFLDRLFPHRARNA